MLNFALPLNALVPRRVTKLMPMPPVCTFRSLPPVLTATSSNASKSKYIDEAPPDVVSVMTTPSRFHIVSVASAPLPTNPDCWPDSLPPTLTRSTVTPGTVLSSAHGSFDCGVLCSSPCVSVVNVPDLLDVDDRRLGGDGHRLLERFHRHRERQRRVDAGGDDHLAFHLVEAAQVGRHLVGAGVEVEEPELPLGIGHRRPRLTADRHRRQRDIDAGQNAAALIRHRPVDVAAGNLGAGARREALTSSVSIRQSTRLIRGSLVVSLPINAHRGRPIERRLSAGRQGRTRAPANSLCGPSTVGWITSGSPVRDRTLPGRGGTTVR